MEPLPLRLEPCVLTFEPQLAERVWGGTTLKRFAKPIPEKTSIGESWEISDVQGKPSVVATGRLQGNTLRCLVQKYARALLGNCLAQEHPEGGLQFPLLLKLLDARAALSLQVHPSDLDLRSQGLQPAGKTEAWVILDAEPGARVIHGLAPGVDRSHLFQRVASLSGGPLPREEEDRLFRWVPVERGDVVFVPAGTIHAVGRGIVLLEVQQASDRTYRIYDWGRVEKDGKLRDLHLADAARVTEPALVPCPFRRLRDVGPGKGFSPLISASDCDKLQLEVVTLGPGTPVGERLGATTHDAGSALFHVLSPFEGDVIVRGCGPSEHLLSPGHFALLPAAVGTYELAAVRRAQVLRFTATG